MMEKAQYLYDQMQTDLLLCKRKGLTPRRETECCFQIADRYWAILRHELGKYEFESMAEEIKFFKEVKPRFTSEMEYFSLCYHARLFVEETSQEDHPTFWEREQKRLEKFITEYSYFIEQYRAGSTVHDAEWFVRKDQENRAATCHDHLVASLLALERYDEYIRVAAGRNKNEWEK